MPCCNLSDRAAPGEQRERAISQLRTTIEKAGGKPTDDQLIFFERESYSHPSLVRRNFIRSIEKAAELVDADEPRLAVGL